MKGVDAKQRARSVSEKELNERVAMETQYQMISLII
jgi:hypothetical protein